MVELLCIALAQGGSLSSGGSEVARLKVALTNSQNSTIELQQKLSVSEDRFIELE
jgi:hypothetical protein